MIFLPWLWVWCSMALEEPSLSPTNKYATASPIPPTELILASTSYTEMVLKFTWPACFSVSGIISALYAWNK